VLVGSQVSPAEGGIEGERAALLRLVGELYAHDHMGEGEMTRRMEAIAHAASLEELRSQAGSMPAAGTGEAFLQTSLIERPVQRVAGKGSVIRKKGAWIESRQVLLEGSGSNVRLDLRHYGEGQGLSLELELELRQSSVLVLVPKSFRVVLAVEDSSASVVKTRGRESPDAPNTITARGRVQGCFVKFAYR
ncbi:MAG TPA: hypothetical protein VFL04_01155, partial [Rectinemataceae bacterium]|nr:hypothetical protein [Rectinemataceae bacterium]